MQRHDFSFDLPSHLVAQAPLAERTASRLMVLSGESGDIAHSTFAAIDERIHPNDLLVFNNTKVLAARLFALKDTGGRIEILLERLLPTGQALAQIRASKSPKPDTQLWVCASNSAQASEHAIRVVGREGDFYVLEAPSAGWDCVLADYGHMPLPPYIERPDDEADKERYQTVFAKHAGAVAAPTAGLHFDDPLLDRLRAKGVSFTELTLHVAAGTFQPMRVDNIADHTMHSETVHVPQTVVDAVYACRERGGRVIAVGTTAVRSLETAAQSGTLKPFSGDSNIFLYPGKPFRVVDAMITNFHLPESTLIMLVSAFAGRERVLAAYESAVQAEYRFFSYGDAMLITPSAQVLSMRAEGL